jgi:hypothetical protein
MSKKDSETSKKILELFEISDQTPRRKQSNQIKISYNEEVFFQPNTQEEGKESLQKIENGELSKLINNVINNKLQVNQQTNKDNPIKFNLHFNNNFYSSNHNYVLKSEANKDKSLNTIVNTEKSEKSEEGGGIKGFFSKTIFCLQYRAGSWIWK